MEILVCARRVPDTSENEIRLNRAGNDIERDDLVYSINEPDNYAVEEALQIVARTGGKVTVATVGSDEDEEILRREMAMGAQQGVLLFDEAFNGSDARGIATVLKSYAQKEKFDLILTGVQAEDGGAQVGGMLAALLDYPFASLVNSIEVVDGNKLKVGREIEGGSREIRDRSSLRVVDPNGNQRTTLCRHARHPPGRGTGDSELRRSGPGNQPRRGRRSRSPGETARLLRARPGQRSRDSRRQQRRNR